MIPRAQFKRGIKQEHVEHPWATPAQVKRIVNDHLHHNIKEYSVKKWRK